MRVVFVQKRNKVLKIRTAPCIGACREKFSDSPSETITSLAAFVFLTAVLVKMYPRCDTIPTGKTLPTLRRGFLFPSSGCVPFYNGKCGSDCRHTQITEHFF
jgi:hypothetical protein